MLQTSLSHTTEMYTTTQQPLFGIVWDTQTIFHMDGDDSPSNSTNVWHPNSNCIFLTLQSQKYHSLCMYALIFTSCQYIILNIKQKISMGYIYIYIFIYDHIPLLMPIMHVSMISLPCIILFMWHVWYIRYMNNE